jgi:PAS domain S-box-containing protein
MTDEPASTTSRHGRMSGDGTPQALDYLSATIEEARKRFDLFQIRRLEQAAAPSQHLRSAGTELLTAFEELRVAEAELRQQNEELAVSRELIEVERYRYQELFELAPDAYLVSDRFGSVREANRAAATLLGVPFELLAGRSIATFIDPSVRDEFRMRLEEACASDSSLRWRSAVQRNDSRAVPVSITAAPARTGRLLTGLRWLLRDESDPLAAQHRIDLLGMLSHEVRTPLAAAQGYIELLQRRVRGELSAAQQADIRSIAACHEYLLRVLENVLSIARLDSGHMALEMATVTVDSLLAGVHTYIGPQIEAKGLRYIYTHGDAATTVVADSGKLHQVVLNLLANAIKFTRPGGTIELGWRADDTSIEISVRDTGIGIAAEDIGRVFDPFVRLTAPGVQAGGSGLGLSISRRLARGMGGDVTVVSQPGVGSVFTIILARCRELAAKDVREPPKGD